MSAILVLAGLSLVVSPSWPAVEPAQASQPSQEQVAATCRALEKALGAETADAGTESALRDAVRVVHPQVIAVLETKGLRHPETKVRSGAIEALARMDHPDALKALHAMLERDREELQEAPPLHAALLRGIARHGSEKSIPLLTQDLFQSPDRGVITARILGLGNIRSRSSVEELVQIMRSGPRARVGDFMGELRLALVVLTGEDKGTDQGLWINWYGDHKSTLVVAKEAGELPRELERRWNAYWGLAEKRDRPGKRRARDD
jgi:hypothetical protein